LCALEFDRVRAHFKIAEFVRFLESSAPYICKNDQGRWRVTTHEDSLRSIKSNMFECFLIWLMLIKRHLKFIVANRIICLIPFVLKFDFGCKMTIFTIWLWHL